MKQVVTKLPPPQNVVLTSKVDEDKFYGTTVENDRAYIRKVHYDGKWNLFALDAFSKSNSWPHERHSLQAVIEDQLSLGVNVFEFDSLTELAQWLEKKN